MIKVFLVEDELIIRDGIKNTIDWTGNGFIFCGEASDGELAYQQILESKPDIIITDIKMPFMDGLELSRLVSQTLPKSKIIIISGHEEFAFAQEAIKIGVTEYLLKPINGKELLKVIKKIGEDIITEKEEQEFLEKYEKDLQSNWAQKKRHFFNNLIKGEFSTASLYERAKDLNLDLAAIYYEIIIFKCNNLNKEIGECTTEQLIKKLLINYTDIIEFEQGIQGYIFLLKGSSIEDLKKIEQAFIDELKLQMNQVGASFLGGIGLYVNRLSKLIETYQDAEKAYASLLMANKINIIDKNQIQGIVESETNISFDQLELGKIDFSVPESFLRNGHTSDLQPFMEGFFKSIGSASEQSVLFKQYILMNLYITVTSFMQEIGKEDLLEGKYLISVDEIRNMINNFGSAKEFMIELFRYALEVRDHQTQSKYYQIIDKAKEYIKDHFQEDSLSLNEVSDYSYMSASHFSMIFSAETGNSFIRYLTDIRMCEAKKLLKCTNMKCTDISTSVGYKDSHYFSFLFKKEQGLSPMSYRSKKTSYKE